jgi:CBS-domain-containing membrane protein/ribosome-associated translation inhibitor RaiA
MRLQEIMRAEVSTVGAGEQADAAWQRMWQRRIRHLVVTDDDGKTVGVISQRDLGGPHGKATRRGRTVRELMSGRLVAATPRTTLRQAANLMRGRMVGSLPVLEDGRLVGIVTASDVLDELGRGFARPDVGARRRKQRAAPPSRRKAGPVVSPARRGARPKADAGRARRDRAQGVRRSPLPGWVPREDKREAGREGEVPAYIRSAGVPLARDERAYMRRKLGMKLGKFARSIERVSVRVDDVNGPRGGNDKSCRIKVVLRGLPSIYVENQAPMFGPAFDGALADVERAVRKALKRRRSRPSRLAA